MNQIKYPIAISKKTGNLLKIKDAKNGKKCECICFSCKEDMIAYNLGKKQTHHFRHETNSKCKANYESFIHWLAKEVFKTIDYIVLPPIYGSNLDFDKNLKKSKAVNKILRNYNIHKSRFIKATNEIVLQPKQKVDITTFSIEKEFNTEFGKIRADIVLSTKNVDLIIEPYYSNEIDADKFRKLSCLDKSTISIDLLSFRVNKSFYFELEDFESYIRDNIKCKEWIYIRNKKANKLADRFLSMFDEIFEKSIEKNKHVDNEVKIQELGNKIINFQKEQMNLINKRNDLQIKIETIQKEEYKLGNKIGELRNFIDNLKTENKDIILDISKKIKNI